uniref:Uncharacterized protein n=1 Tax=Timema douglasi TaxID=61478 RepID=A0A7R8Z8V5_TIMDO|nr:unnamed protein product [Timema douglasi]
MWIFSLGVTITQASSSWGTLSPNIRSALGSMTETDPARRASLMNLLDVISDYCKTHSQNKPFSHIVMDLYSEVMGSPSQKAKLNYSLLCRAVFLPIAGRAIFPSPILSHLMLRMSIAQLGIRGEQTQHWFGENNQRSVEVFCLADRRDKGGSWRMAGSGHRRSNSFPKKVYALSPLKENNTNIVKRKQPVKRAPSRLYRTAAFEDSGPTTKYFSPKTCIGPEFVVRAANPSKLIHITGVKSTQRRNVVVILLNGQKLDITCDPSDTTAEKLFEVIVQSEIMEENYTLGLAALLGGDFVFLPPSTKLSKIASAVWSGDTKKHTVPLYSFTLYVRVRFFLPSLRGIGSWFTKHHLFLQLRRSLLEQLIECSLVQHVGLSGLALQAEFGDYQDQEHGCEEYFLLEHYIPDNLLLGTDEVVLKARLQNCHRQRKGLDPGRAEEMFIAQVQCLPTYGSHFFSATWLTKTCGDIPMWVSVSGEGVSLHSRTAGCDKHLRQQFAWKDIKKLSYSKHYLLILPGGDSSSKAGKLDKFKLKMEHKKSGYVFHLVSLHHQFFLKLRVQLSTLQSLAAEFGVPVVKSPQERYRLFYVEDNSRSKVSELDRQQYRLLAPPRRADNLEEAQNKENENPQLVKVISRLESESVCGDFSRQKPTPESIRRATSIELTTPRRVRVKMGTRAFASSQKELFPSCDSGNKENEVDHHVSEKQPEGIPESVLDSDAFVVNSSIKSVDERFEIDIHESLSESFLQKFNNISFEEERILKTVMLERDEDGSLGIKIIEGSDGGLYIQSILPHGSAAKLGLIHKGDQLIAANGRSLLNMRYEEALQLLQSLSRELELVLSQSCRNTPNGNIIHHSSAIDLMNAVLKSSYSREESSSPNFAGGNTEEARYISLPASRLPSDSELEKSCLGSIRLEMEAESQAKEEDMAVTFIPRRGSHSRVLSSPKQYDGIRSVCCVMPVEEDNDQMSPSSSREESFL